MADLISLVLAKSQTKTQALGLLCDWEGDRDIKKDYSEEEFEKAKQRIRRIEPLYLYLPVLLPEEVLNKILIDLRKEYGREFLLEIKLKPDLIAGAAMSYKGVYKDYSIKNRLNNGNWLR